MDFSMNNNLVDITKNVVDVNPMVLIEMGMIIQNDEQETNYSQQQEEEDRMHIQMQHKIRQQMLLMHLDKLRAKDKKRKLAQPQPQQSSNFGGERNNEGLIFLEDDGSQPQNSSSDDQVLGSLDISEHWSQKHSSNPQVSKWLGSMLRSLDQAHHYVKSSGRKTEQWSKFFPSASHSFESRCADLRQDLLRLELNIERFQNIFTKQLDKAEMKMKSFIADFHLETFAHEMGEDDDDEARDNREESSIESSQYESHSGAINDRTNSSIRDRSSGKMSGSFNDFSTQNDLSDNEGEALIDCRDMEPVPEIRDVNSDSPIPVDEFSGDINLIDSEDEESNYICVKSTSSRVSPSPPPPSLSPTLKPTVTIKSVKLSSTPNVNKVNSDTSSKGEVSSTKGPQNKRNALRLSAKRSNQSTPETSSTTKLKTSNQKRKR
ncbi:uncharacterized protein LOC107364025 [Tetranychus urticae]|nr:uncharacterized protein LOC107364025 [Tetranychus urticae]XP_015786787.1 uncharacterized protein LOC107364025 [Tetranychus urticae]